MPIFSDLTFWLYLADVVFGFFALAVFIWWWTRTEGAKPFYIYMTLLIAGIFLRSVGDVIRLSYFYTDFDRFICIADEPWWDLRLVPGFIALVCISIHVTARLVRRDK